MSFATITVDVDLDELADMLIMTVKSSDILDFILKLNRVEANADFTRDLIRILEHSLREGV